MSGRLPTCRDRRGWRPARSAPSRPASRSRPCARRDTSGRPSPRRDRTRCRRRETPRAPAARGSPGSSRSVSIVPGAEPRTSTPATAPASDKDHRAPGRPLGAREVSDLDDRARLSVRSSSTCLTRCVPPAVARLDRPMRPEVQPDRGHRHSLHRAILPPGECFWP